MKQFKVPDHLICPIRGDVMEDPVMIQSGMTYNRTEIERYLQLQQQSYQERLDEDDDDFDKENFYKCPITYSVIDPAVRIPNKRIKDACDAFLDANPWSFEFDPRE